MAANATITGLKLRASDSAETVLLNGIGTFDAAGNRWNARVRVNDLPAWVKVEIATANAKRVEFGSFPPQTSDPYTTTSFSIAGVTVDQPLVISDWTKAIAKDRRGKAVTQNYRVEFYREPDQPPPPPEPRVEVAGLRLRRNGVDIGLLESGSQWTPADLAGVRVEALVSGDIPPGFVCQMTLAQQPSGAVLKSVPEANPPYEIGLPALAEGSYTFAAAPTGGAAVTVAFSVREIIQPPPPPDPDLRQLQAIVGVPLHVRLDDAQLALADVQERQWMWDFGDPLGRHNTLHGFNAVHEYASPGSYTVRLNGQPWAQISVAADSRPVLNVTSGADLILKARQDNVILILPPGDMNLGATVYQGVNVEVRAHPSGSRLLWNAPLDRNNSKAMFAGNAGCVLRGFRQGVAGMGEIAGDANRIGLVLTYPQNDSAIIGVEFENIDDVGNFNRRPHRSVLMDCRAVWLTSLRSYLAWVEGEQIVVAGNHVENATDESVIRCAPSSAAIPGPRLVLVASNYIRNIDRRPIDPNDIAKGCVVFQTGELGYAWNNDLGISGMGPLAINTADAFQRWRKAAWVSNHFADKFEISHGSESVYVGGNTWDTGTIDVAIRVDGYNAAYGRGVRNLVIQDNPSIASRGSRTRLLWVRGAVMDRFDVRRNGFATGSLSMSGDHPLIFDAPTQGHYDIDDNRLAASKLNPSIVAKVANSEKTLAAFNDLPGVGENRLA